MKIILALVVLIIIAVIGFSAIKKSSRQEEKDFQGTTFYYYPKRNLYYDLDRKRYIFLSEDLKTWLYKKEVSREEQATLGKHSVITNPATPIWKDNGQHKLIYGVTLYTSPENVQKQFFEDSLNSLPKKPTSLAKKNSPENKKDKKHKSGIGKFFDKIFRK